MVGQGLGLLHASLHLGAVARLRLTCLCAQERRLSAMGTNHAFPPGPCVQARLAALREQQQQQEQEQGSEEDNSGGAPAVAPESREQGAEPGPEPEHSAEVPQTVDRTEL